MNVNLIPRGRKAKPRLALAWIIATLLLPIEATAQDLRLYITIPEDTLNHTSTYEPFKKIYFSEYQPDQNRNWKGWILDKTLHENFLILKQKNYHLTFDPVFDLFAGQELVSGKPISTNTRGFRVQGAFDSKLIFSTTYHESQSKFAPYLDSIIQEHRVTPGQQDYRGWGEFMDHSYATGWLRYTPNELFSFEAGQGKNFFGNGYRSMLLSDANLAYPYFRIDTRFWRVHYVSLWAEFQDQNGWQGYGYPYQKKYAAMHYLSFALSERLEISAFEVINWQGRDSTHTRNFELAYLNPVIFFRPVEWTLGSPDNALIGLNLSYKIMPQSYLYGQLLFDEFVSSKVLDFKTGYSSNKYAGQVGVKVMVPFGRAKWLRGEEAKSVFFQSEFNFARPYTYSHVSSKSNYGSMNFSMAHPLGGNFMEWVNFIRLNWGRLSLEGRYSWAKFGAEENGSNYGHDIFLPYDYETELTGIFIGYGKTNTLTYSGITAAYLLNPYSNFNLFVSLLNRNQKNDQMEKQDLIVTFGLRSSLRNLYYDF